MRCLTCLLLLHAFATSALANPVPGDLPDAEAPQSADNTPAADADSDNPGDALPESDDDGAPTSDIPGDETEITAPDDDATEPADDTEPSEAPEPTTLPLPEPEPLKDDVLTGPEGTKGKVKLIEELTFEQWPGLPPAASKIYFTDRRWAISGYGELSYNHFLGEKNRATGDLELYNTNLYRFVVYGAVRATDWLVLYAEVFAEVLHDGNREVAFDALPEIFADFLITRGFNIRAGWAQIPIGYINNNDEPTEYHSVNRPEVERVIIPSQWIELGLQFYGKIGDKASWMVHGFQGSDGRAMLGASWVRGGRHPKFDYFAPGVAAQFNVNPIEHLELSVSTLFMETGTRRLVSTTGGLERVRSPTSLHSAYVRYEEGDFSLLALGTFGTMGQTDLMFHLTDQLSPGPAQLFGRQVYGAYAELGWDILPLIRGRSARSGGSFFHRASEMKLPLFFRYERLDTHASLAPDVAARVNEGVPLFRNNLDVFTLGMNFKTRRNIVFKANYQFRYNRASNGEAVVPEGDRFEVGFGFLF